MKLKKRIKNLEEVDEQYRGLYTQSGDGFVLEVDGDDSAARIAEFRDNNIKLKEQLESMEQKLKKLSDFEGLDQEAARNALEELQKQKDQKLLSEGKLEEVLAQRTETMRSNFEGKIEALQNKLDATTKRASTFEEKYKTNVIDSQIQNAVSNFATVRPGAMRHVLASARDVWTIDEEGNPVAMKDGKVVYGKDGSAPLTMEEWGEGLYREAEYLFEPNSGAGAGGNRSSNGAGGKIGAGDVSGVSLEELASGSVTVE